MDYRIDWRDQSLKNLKEIREYIERVSFSVEIADRILGDIFDHVEGLSTFPNRYPLAKEHPLLRKMVAGEYNVYYRVLESPPLVQIVLIKHGAVDIKRHLEQFVML